MSIRTHYVGVLHLAQENKQKGKTYFQIFKFFREELSIDIGWDIQGLHIPCPISFYKHKLESKSWRFLVLGFLEAQDALKCYCMFVVVTVGEWVPLNVLGTLIYRFWMTLCVRKRFRKVCYQKQEFYTENGWKRSNMHNVPSEQAGYPYWAPTSTGLILSSVCQVLMNYIALESSQKVDHNDEELPPICIHLYRTYKHGM